MTRLLVFLALATSLIGCAPQTKVGRCNGVLISPNEIVTAAHCLPQYNGGVTSIRASERMVKATPSEVDGGRDVARLTLSEPVYAPYYGMYREPTVGATGFVFGGCPLRISSAMSVMAAERVIGVDGVARWEWLVRNGQVSCGGDSGSPIWSGTEFGVYYGNVSRYERLQMRIGDTLVLLDAGTTLYSGAGE